MTYRILIIDDDVTLTRTWSRVLRTAGYDVDIAESVDAARAVLSNASCDAIILDLKLPDGQGTDLLDHLAQQQARPPSIAIASGFIDSALVVKHHRRVDMFVPKPITADDLVRVVQSLVAAGREHDAAEAFCERFALSDREGEVLREATRGAQNKEIATRLGCELSTITTYWKRIFEKVGRRSRNEVLAELLLCSRLRSSRGSGVS